MQLIDALEYANFPADPALKDSLRANADDDTPFAPGQYSLAWEEDGAILLARDPLGCNKLFYGRTPAGDLVAANRIDRALMCGVRMDDLASCPPGHLVRCPQTGDPSVRGRDISTLGERQGFDLPAFQRRIRAALEKVMTDVRRTWPEAVFAVCLSGGIDSSAILAVAKEALPAVEAFSFSYLPADDLRAWLDGAAPESLGGASDDFRAAVGVARAFDVPLSPVFRTVDAIIPAVEPAVRLCQDWRDFNVHCAVVNLFLAENIRSRFPGRLVVVLTGDLMNEFVCDYREEMIDGTIYYPQPRVPTAKRRRFLVRGLDAGDREIGVFSAFGLRPVQPYAAVAEHYLGLSPELLEKVDAKLALNGHLLPPEVNGVVSRIKRRAQVGGADGGTLGGFHRMKIDQACLQRVWVRSLPAALRGDRPEEIIQVGRYRTTTRSA